ncbi:bromodomain-containing protein DDB_G0280777 [Drosophila busckii]|uniref:bromodomain-containing protein DDB_G0280777 n=1 Tax=Drosophila busckii TaxID=30019 RepID=UPI00083F4297|nr:bromodomain-containing protein DDB_G0280777 [Drosophila busckii]
MAEVEKMTASAPSDIPISSPHEADTGAAANNTIELGTSPTQEPSSNSLPHDSEYDTASDLEGGEDYDDDESGSGSEDETETESDDEEEDGVGSSGTVSGNGMERGVADSEAQKKVDEDRSNPQYIPKRGTFYEHDDRTAEEGGAGPEAGTESSQINVEPNGGDAPNGVLNIGAATVGQSPTISHASKTMKKWQAASGGDRWSHDRFEANEQAPKSRAELLQTYGYDIRNEDAAPRARRRRRYGRGPSKYSRNWEDEQAYLKASNKERKPPRPQDFPALNEHGSSGSRKLRRPRTSTSREEKENRGERRGTASGSNNAAITISSGLPPKLKEALDRERDRELERERERERERIPSERDRDGKNRNYGRANGGQGSSSRQNAMDFKQKSNRGPQREQRDYGEREQRPERDYHQKSSANRSNGPQKQHNHDVGRDQAQHSHQQQRQLPQEQQQPQQQQQHQQATTQQKQPQATIITSNLSQRLQQVQQRNDPSHVGSVQMHSLAAQNQQQQQQQLHLQQQQQPPQEQRNGPKRYSSLRRTQHEATQTQQHLAEQQQQQQQLQQQLQLQQQQQQQPPPPPQQIIMQDPHVLMQIAYQQQELQAQLQNLQLAGTAATAAPPQAKPHAPTAAAYPQVQAAPYYVTPGEPVPVPVPVSVSVPVAQTSYVNPASAGYLPPTPAAVAYAQAQSPQPAPAAPQPTTQAAQAPPPSINYHQNYNTVGGTTYFVPPVQAPTRPAVLPQRRPTNAIPILPPSEKHKTRNANSKADSEPPSGSADNIDHIIDNMFVQRPAFQPPGEPTEDVAGAQNTAVVADLNHQAVAVPGQE